MTTVEEARRACMPILAEADRMNAEFQAIQKRERARAIRAGIPRMPIRSSGSCRQSAGEPARGEGNCEDLQRALKMRIREARATALAIHNRRCKGDDR